MSATKCLKSCFGEDWQQSTYLGWNPTTAYWHGIQDLVAKLCMVVWCYSASSIFRVSGIMQCYFSPGVDSNSGRCVSRDFSIQFVATALNLNRITRIKFEESAKPNQMHFDIF